MKIVASLVFVLLCGCATTAVTRAPDRDLSRLKRIYLVWSDDTSLNRLIEDNLAARGYVVGAGAENAAPAGIQAIVTYNYNRHWDMALYLEYLEIEFRDPATKAIIVRAEAHHTTFERQTDSDEVAETVGKLCGDH